MPNIHSPRYEEGERPEGFRARRARFGYGLGTELIGCSLFEVPPQEAAYPYHFHYADEELVIVLAGRPTLRTPGGERELEQGETVSFPLGEEGAHQLLNRGDQPVRFLAVSSHGRPDIVVYPDSGKIGVGERLPHGGGLRAFFRRGDAVDYWTDERPPRPTDAAGCGGAGENPAGRSPPPEPTTMDASEVVAVLDCLDRHRITSWVDGGWGVDALMGERTRTHRDLDLVVAEADREAAERALGALGYDRDAAARPGLPARSVLRGEGRQVDLHLVVFDSGGNAWQPLGDGAWGGYPADGLSGAGAIGERRVRCLTPQLQLRHHLGYPLGESDHHDLHALAERFGLGLPPGV